MLKIMGNKDLKRYRKNLAGKKALVDRLRGEYEFMLPKEHSILQKRGRLLGKSVIRSCFMTLSTFG